MSATVGAFLLGLILAPVLLPLAFGLALVLAFSVAWFGVCVWIRISGSEVDALARLEARLDAWIEWNRRARQLETAVQPSVVWVGEPIELGSEEDHSLGSASMRARIERIKREMGR